MSVWQSGQWYREYCHGCLDSVWYPNKPTDADASMAFWKHIKGNYYTQEMTHTALAPVQQFSMWSYTHMLPSLFLCEHLLISIVALVTSVCLRGASLCKQNLESHKGPLHNSVTRHRALLHSTHVNDRPSFLALSLGWFKCILGSHCVLTRRNTFSATSDLSVYTDSKNV